MEWSILSREITLYKIKKTPLKRRCFFVF
jgi:hypothetical protein